MHPARRWLLLAAAATALALGACSEQGAAPKPASAPLRIGAYYWPGTYWVDIADQKGWFKEAGLNVERVDTNADFFASLDQVVDGRLDVGGFTLFDLVLYNARGKHVVGFVAGDYSNGAEALVARPAVASVGALAGKKVALSKGTYLEYQWSVIERNAALKPGAVTLVDAPSEQAAATLKAGQADAVLSWEPFAGDALAAVQGRRLWDSSQMPGISPSLFAVRAELAATRGADLQTLVGVWQRATAFLKAQPEAAYAIVAAVNHKPVAEVRDFAAKDKILDLRDNLAAFEFAPGLESLHGSARQMNDFMLRTGMTRTRLDTATLLDSRYLRHLQITLGQK